MLHEAEMLERDWQLSRIFLPWLRCTTVRMRREQPQLVPFCLVDGVTGRGCDAMMHPRLLIGDVATAFATHVSNGIGMRMEGQRLRVEHMGLYVHMEDTIADVVDCGRKSRRGRYRLRITFHDDTRTDCDSEKDVDDFLNAHARAGDVQQYFTVDPASLEGLGPVRLLPPPGKPLKEILLGRLQSRWKASFMFAALLLFFWGVPYYPCPCQVWIIVLVWVAANVAVFSDLPNDVLMAVFIAAAFGCLALWVTLNVSVAFGAFLFVTWALAVAAAVLNALPRLWPHRKEQTDAVLPYLLGLYWVILAVFYLEFEYGAPMYMTITIIVMIVATFLVCHRVLNMRWGWVYIPMLVYST
eukprot:gene1116-1457_t